MKTKYKAFTLTELLVVIAIIGLLVGLAVPALMGAKKAAKKMAEKNNLTNMELAIEQFKLDHGFYPESGERQIPLPVNLVPPKVAGPGPKDQGAHLLFEAMAGLDTLGYEESHYYWYEDGGQGSGQTIGTPIKWNDAGTLILTAKRWEYMDLSKTRYGVIGDHVDPTVLRAHPGSNNFGSGSNPNYVFLDNLEWNEPRAILYYRARKSGKVLADIYKYDDNVDITMDTNSDGYIQYREMPNPNDHSVPNFDAPDFYVYIVDPRTEVTGVSVAVRPFNKDTFLLISAGWDHIYGTEDDITNFNK